MKKAVLMFAIVALLATCTAFASTEETKVFSARAYGTFGFVGSKIDAGKAAPVGLGSGCGTTALNQNKTGTITSVHLAPIGFTGAVDTTASDTSLSSIATSSVVDVNLLAGLVHGDV